MEAKKSEQQPVAVEVAEERAKDAPKGIGGYRVRVDVRAGQGYGRKNLWDED